MSFLLRLIRILLLAAFGPRDRTRHGLLEPSRIRLRVWPNDLDLNIHMNNGRYLSLMDLGRMDLMTRTGALRLWVSRGWAPLVGLSLCRHFKALTLFQSFDLETRVLGWDEKWLYFEQRYMAGGKLYALAVVKGLMAGSKGPVPTAELFNTLGFGAEASPALPEWVNTWLKAESQAIALLKAERDQA